MDPPPDAQPIAAQPSRRSPRIQAQQSHAVQAHDDDAGGDIIAPAGQTSADDAVGTTQNPMTIPAQDPARSSNANPAPGPAIGSRAYLDQAVRAFLEEQGRNSVPLGSLSPGVMTYAMEILDRERTSILDPTPHVPQTAAAAGLRPSVAQLLPVPNRVYLQTPDKFKGVRTDVDRFERAVERYVRAADIDGSIMTLIPTLLAGDAETWYNAVERNGTLPPTWVEFKVLMQDRFGDPASVRKARDRLDKLQHVGTVAQLRSAYETLLLDIPAMNPEDQVDKFVKKLRNPIRFHVDLKEPKTLEEAFRHAEKVELADNIGRGKVLQEEVQSPNPSSTGRGRRGHGRGRSQDAAFQQGQGNYHNNNHATQAGKHGYRPQQPMALATMGHHAAPPGTPVNAGINHQAHAGPGVNAMQTQPAKGNGRGNMAPADYDRCFKEHRCYYCKQDMRLVLTPHHARNCPAKQRGELPTAMPPPLSQSSSTSQDARQGPGNDPGRWRQ